MAAPLKHRSLSQLRENGLNHDALIWALIIKIVGFIGIILISLLNADCRINSCFRQIFGISILMSLTAAITGGFLGFLFGIPRSLQKNEVATAVTADKPRKSRPFSNNTNLEEISDWLTKIIVGVGLIELKRIMNGFHNLSIFFSRAFQPVLPTNIALPYVYTLLLLYGICGFLVVFLWARIYLFRQLIILDRSFDVLEIAKQVNTNQDKKSKIRELERDREEFKATNNRVVSRENLDYKDVIAKAKPGVIKYLDDCQKGRWGGHPVVDGYSLSAEYKKLEHMEEELYYEITITATSLEKKPLEGNVYFFVHDSYFPDTVRKVAAENNHAKIIIVSFEAFTIGAYIENTDIKLELDMNLDPTAPADYKYQDPLVSIDDINKSLAELQTEEVEDLSY